MEAAVKLRAKHPDIDVTAADVGRRIRQARLERGLSLAQLGGTDLSRSFLSLVENGRSRISLKALLIVANRLELPVSHFLDDATRVDDLVAELTLNEAEVQLRQRRAEGALRLLDQVTAPDPLRANALWLRGWALVLLGRTQEALPVLTEGLGFAQQQGDTHLAAQLEYKLAAAFYGAGHYDEALAHFRKVLELLGSDPDPNLAGKATASIGHVLYAQKDFDGAIAYYTRAAELFGSVRDFDTLGCIYSGLSLVYKRNGNLATALRYSRLSVSTFEASHNIRDAAAELNNMAVSYRSMGEWEEARRHASDAIDRANQIDAPDLLASARATLASVYLHLGDLDAAEQEAQAADQVEPDQSSPRFAATLKVLADIAERRGEPQRADEYYLAALDLLREKSNHTVLADTALAYSQILHRRGNLEGAFQYAVQAAQAGARLTP